MVSCRLHAARLLPMPFTPRWETIAWRQNQRWVAPLTHEIKTGDRVETLTNKSSKSPRDWLKIV